MDAQRDDREELAGYVGVWQGAADDVLALLDTLDEADWDRPTDLPGWRVRDVAAHLAHLESLLAGLPQPAMDVDEPPAHARPPMGPYTESGVQDRRDRAPAELVAELREAVDRRRTALAADPPTDAAAPATGPLAYLGWDTRTLFANRPVDLWMHEQDIRRAVDRPGGTDSAGARHTVGRLAAALGFVLVKRAGATPGTTLVLEVDGHPPRAFEVSEDGRGKRRREVPEQPELRLGMTPATFAVLAGGRRDPGDVEGEVRVEGDDDLARRVLGGMAVTP